MTPPPVLTSPLLARAGVRHAFFTRQGGVSGGIYDSLNLGRGSNDDPAAVEANRARAAQALGVAPEALNTCHQIHSAQAVVADEAWGEGRPQADAVVTARADLACCALAADCAPVLIADLEAGVVAAAHAGWRGALDGVVAAAVQTMTGLGARPERMVAAVGPCIGPASYEVGLEFLDRFVAADAASARFFAPGASADKRMFDLPAFVLERLRAAGVEACEWIGRDTVTEPALFFSNRRAFKTGEPDYGRLMSAIRLN